MSQPIANAATIIRILTTVSLAGLLLSVGLRLTVHQVRDALRRSHLRWLLPVNFVGIPLITLGLIRAFNIPPDIATGMLLLSAAPFAPVVPVFARMARGADLALAAGLTALFPLASSFLTPLICELALRAIPGSESLRFSVVQLLIVLIATITLPLSLGVIVHHALPRVAKAALRPMEILSEATGAISLAFVTCSEFRSILQTGWKPLVAMVITFELSLLLGHALSGPTRDVRRVMALGTSNRNIALALLIAVQSFPNTPVMGAVVANGLVLILLGLLHVAWWRFARSDAISSI